MADSPYELVQDIFHRISSSYWGYHISILHHYISHLIIHIQSGFRVFQPFVDFFFQRRNFVSHWKGICFKLVLSGRVEASPVSSPFVSIFFGWWILHVAKLLLYWRLPIVFFFLDAWVVRCFLGNSSQTSFASGTTTNKNASLAISLSC